MAPEPASAFVSSGPPAADADVSQAQGEQPTGAFIQPTQGEQRAKVVVQSAQTPDEPSASGRASQAPVQRQDAAQERQSPESELENEPEAAQPDSASEDATATRTPFNFASFIANTPDYQYELQNPQLERLRSMQSRGFSGSAASTNSALSRLYSGTTPGSPSSYSHTNSSNSRSLTHTDSASTNPSSYRPASIGPAQPTLNGNAASTNLDAAAATIFEEPKTESLDLDWILSQERHMDSASSDASDHPSSITSSSHHFPSDSTPPLAWDKEMDDPEYHLARSSLSSENSSMGHYHPANDVISRMEMMGERAMKAIVTCINLAEYLGLAIVAVVVIPRATGEHNEFLKHDYLWAINVAVGGLCLVCLYTVTAIWMKRIYGAWRAGKAWSLRRRRGFGLLTVDIFVQLVNISVFMANNVFVLVRACRWFSPPVLWMSFTTFMCFNTLFCTSVMRAHWYNLWVDKRGKSLGPRPDAILMDGPLLKVHWPLLVLWVIGAGLKIGTEVPFGRIRQLPEQLPLEVAAGSCRQYPWDCRHTKVSATMLALMLLLFLVYVSLFLFYMFRTFRQLKDRPYRDWRMSNFASRFMLRTRTLALMLFLVCIVFYSVIQFDNCSTWAAQLLGYLPMQCIFTAILTTEAYAGMPKDANNDKEILQVWLQEFAWTEKEKLSKIKARGSSLPDDTAQDLWKEPMFCFETAVKMYYYAHLVYDYEQVIDETFNDPRHKKAAAPGSCEHMDMCPIASTAKLKRRCQEGKRDCEPARSCRPCHEHGFWAGVRKLFGLQPCPEEFRKRQEQLQEARPAGLPLPIPTNPSSMLSPAYWTARRSSQQRKAAASEAQEDPLQVAGWRIPPKEERKRGKKAEKRKSKRKQRAQAEFDLKAAEEGTHGHENGVAADSAPKQAAMQNGNTQNGHDSAHMVKSASSSSLDGKADGSEASEHEPGLHRESRFQRVVSYLTRCSGCSSTSDTTEEGTHGPTLADTHGRHRSGSRRPEFMLDTALGMYDLKHVEVFWERLHDTHALLAWGPSRCVIVFRGTASFANVLADLQAWQLVHPPKRGSWWLGTQPCVHKGFLRSYTANSLNKRLIDRVVEVVREAAANPNLPKFLVLVTGHSLGGALSKLAAYDIAKATQSLPLKVHVTNYTFGAPRVGNHAFASDFNEVVPDSWSLINDQDAVARQAKFWTYYKRPGQRVLINPQGDLLVRPTFVELSIHNRPFSSSVSQHMLLSYRTSLAAVVKAQLDRRKRLHGGLAGMMRVLEGQFLRDILAPAGVVYDEVLKKSKWAALDHTAMKRLKHKSTNPDSFRIRAPVLARARKLDEEAAAAAVAAADGCPSGWEGIDYSSAMSCRPCPGHMHSTSSSSDDIVDNLDISNPDVAASVDIVIDDDQEADDDEAK